MVRRYGKSARRRVRATTRRVSISDAGAAAAARRGLPRERTSTSQRCSRAVAARSSLGARRRRRPRPAVPARLRARPSRFGGLVASPVEVFVPGGRLFGRMGRHQRLRISPDRPCASSMPTSTLVSCDNAGAIEYDERLVPLADGGIVREAQRDELIARRRASCEMMLPGRNPLTTIGPIAERATRSPSRCPAGYTRLFLPAYATRECARAAALWLYVCLRDRRPSARCGDEDR